MPKNSIQTGLHAWLLKDFEQNRPNIAIGGWTAFLAHPAYFFFFIYGMPGFNDNAAIRFSAAILSIPLMALNLWSERYHPWLNLYRYVWVTFVLPIPPVPE